MEIKLSCYSCQKEIVSVTSIARRDDCPHCHADMHVCANCEFYDIKVYNECKETSAEVVREKMRSNYCDFFSPRKTGTSAVLDKAAQLRAAAEALFKKN